MSLCRLWVKDKQGGRVHEVGTEQHDSLWVDSDGCVHYHNLQNGDGANGGGDGDGYDYVFMPYDCGELEGGAKHKFVLTNNLTAGA